MPASASPAPPEADEFAGSPEGNDAGGFGGEGKVGDVEHGLQPIGAVGIGGVLAVVAQK
jgi:hypothetical protein